MFNSVLYPILYSHEQDFIIGGGGWLFYLYIMYRMILYTCDVYRIVDDGLARIYRIFCTGS